MSTFNFKKLQHIGPGGIKCPCCTDNAHKRINEHTFYNRKVRKILRNLLKKELNC